MSFDKIPCEQFLKENSMSFNKNSMSLVKSSMSLNKFLFSITWRYNHKKSKFLTTYFLFQQKNSNLLYQKDLM